MKQIAKDYLITRETFILLPAHQIEYNTIVIEKSRQLFVQKTAMQLIKESCIAYGSTFNGRRRAVMQRTDFSQKVPIPISINNDIYTFPTHSLNDYNCAWIFPKHVQLSKHIPSIKYHANEKSMIVFNGSIELELDISEHILQRQLERTELCRYVFTEGVQY